MTLAARPKSFLGNMSLRAKFITLVTLILIFTEAIIIAASIRTQNQIYKDQLLEKGHILGSFLSKASHEAILAFDIVLLNNYVKEASSRQDIYYTVILDSNGFPLTSYLDETNSCIKEAISKINSGKPLEVINHLKKRNDVIHQEYPINFNQKQIGTILLGLCTTRLTDKARETLILLLLANLGLILFLNLAIYLVFRSQTLKPISNLIEGSNRIAQGDFTHPVEVHSKDELGDLSLSFNSMMDLIAEKQNRLISAQKNLEEHKKNLEQTVQERTHELQATNEELSEEILERKQLATSLFEEKIRLEETQNELEKAYTDLKQAQSQMLQREKMASVGQLAAGVAHEINNPIGFVSSNLCSLQKYLDKILIYTNAQQEVLQQGVTEERLADLDSLRKKMKIDFIIEDCPDLLVESLDGTDRVQKIVQNLKTFSRMDEAKYRKTDLNSDLESTVNMVKNEIKYKASLIKDYGDIPLTFCYPNELNQVFMNLLVNASQSIEKKGEITLTTSSNGESIIIKISDTGSGMPKEVKKRIFEPFYTTKDVGKGTGLGLSIAFDIIKKHNGDISVESQEGEGTTFTITLPVVDKSEDTTPSEPEQNTL